MKFLKWYSAIVIFLSFAVNLIDGIANDCGDCSMAAIMLIPVVIYLWSIIVNRKFE